MNQEATKIALIDMDGTLIEGQTQQDLIKFFYLKGELSIFYLLFLNVWFLLYKIHITDNVENIFKFGLKYLAGKSITKISPLVDDYIDRNLKKKIYPGSFVLLKNLRAEGYKIIILSAAVDLIVSKVLKIFEADEFISTKLEIINGVYTGGIEGKIVAGVEKVTLVERYFNSNGYSFKESRAYGDRESDIPLLKMVQNGYIVNPNRRMLNLAKKYKLGTIDLKSI